MQVLVLGAAGNIGRELCHHLTALGHVVYRADLRPGWAPDYYNLDVACSLDPVAHLQPEVVIHLAGMVSRVTCEQSPAAAVRANVTGMQHVLDYCARVGARLVYASSSEVYGPTAGLMREDAVLQPINRYGVTKALAEALAGYEAETYGLDVTILRLFMVYGPREDRGAHRSALVRFADELAHGRPIIVHRDTARSWLHVFDACRAFAAALPRRGYNIVNVGHPDGRPMDSIAHRLADLLDADQALVGLAAGPRDITPRKDPDLSRQRDLLGFTPEITLEYGLGELAAEAKKWPA